MAAAEEQKLADSRRQNINHTQMSEAASKLDQQIIGRPLGSLQTTQTQTEQSQSKTQFMISILEKPANLASDQRSRIESPNTMQTPLLLHMLAGELTSLYTRV